MAGTKPRIADIVPFPFCIHRPNSRFLTPSGLRRQTIHALSLRSHKAIELNAWAWFNGGPRITLPTDATHTIV